MSWSISGAVFRDLLSPKWAGTNFGFALPQNTEKCEISLGFLPSVTVARWDQQTGEGISSCGQDFSSLGAI